MPDPVKIAEAQARPWYKVRRIRGCLLGVIGAALISIPAAPAIVTIGAFALTTQTVGILVSGVATYIYGYGSGAKVEREK